MNVDFLKPFSDMMVDRFGSGDQNGNCFAAAYHLAEAMLDNKAAKIVHIVHGVVHRPKDGTTHYHAWVEIFVQMGVKRGWLVLDASNGKSYCDSRAKYYAVGHIQQSRILRYDIQSASRRAISEGHYGPWQTPWPVDHKIVFEEREPNGSTTKQ